MPQINVICRSFRCDVVIHLLRTSNRSLISCRIITQNTKHQIAFYRQPFPIVSSHTQSELDRKWVHWLKSVACKQRPPVLAWSRSVPSFAMLVCWDRKTQRLYTNDTHIEETTKTNRIEWYTPSYSVKSTTHTLLHKYRLRVTLKSTIIIILLLLFTTQVGTSSGSTLPPSQHRPTHNQRQSGKEASSDV